MKRYRFIILALLSLILMANCCCEEYTIYQDQAFGARIDAETKVFITLVKISEDSVYFCGEGEDYIQKFDRHSPTIEIHTKVYRVVLVNHKIYDGWLESARMKISIKEIDLINYPEEVMYKDDPKIAYKEDSSITRPMPGDEEPPGLPRLKSSKRLGFNRVTLNELVSDLGRIRSEVEAYEDREKVDYAIGIIKELSESNNKTITIIQ